MEEILKLLPGPHSETKRVSTLLSLSLPFSFAVASIFFFVLLIECFSLNVFAYHKKI
jgi:hypothetical protein